MSRSYMSNWTSVGSKTDPDTIYYNASIVNNTTDDTNAEGYASADPIVRFNETRDIPIIRDASQYQVSIIRFVINGANKDLPLFIPAIQSSTGQTDPNLTEYGFGMSLKVRVGPTTYVIAPEITYVEYIPETQNPILAPVPNPPSSPFYVGAWVIANSYTPGNIVSVLTTNPEPSYYQANLPVPPNTALTTFYTDPTTGRTTPYWSLTSSQLGRPQDLNSRYYWVYTFQHWVSLCQTALERANEALYNAYVIAVSPNASYPTYTSWLQAYPTPIMSYDSSSLKFSITYPDIYLQTFDPLTPGSSQIGLWMNQNMEGLFSNFYNIIYNTPQGNEPAPVSPPFPFGYVYNMVVQIQNLGANVIPKANIIPATTYGGATFIRMTQECLSTSTLWCPVESLVFTSNLLPLQNEQTAPPNTYGTGNIGISAPTAPSAFQPIITDIANDLSSDPYAWRKMIYYAPVAEYRMCDFQNSKAEIKNIDIQVYWKNRLNNTLYPLRMFNLSSVSIKIMFRKKKDEDKTERLTNY